MIEAVNSVLSNAAVTSRVAEQQSTSRSLSANPEKIQEVAKTPYVSPYISIDRQSNKAVLQIRDSNTGDVVNQYPTKGQLKAYQAAQQASLRADKSSQEAPSVSTSSQSSPKVPEVAQADVPSISSVDTEA